MFMLMLTLNFEVNAHFEVYVNNDTYLVLIKYFAIPTASGVPLTVTILSCDPSASSAILIEAPDLLLNEIFKIFKINFFCEFSYKSKPNIRRKCDRRHSLINFEI